MTERRNTKADDHATQKREHVENVGHASRLRHFCTRFISDLVSLFTKCMVGDSRYQNYIYMTKELSSVILQEQNIYAPPKSVRDLSKSKTCRVAHNSDSEKMWLRAHLGLSIISFYLKIFWFVQAQ